MAFGAKHKDIVDKKKTGYFLDDKEITLTKQRGRKPVIRNPAFITQEKKIEAASLYTVLGDIKQVAKLTQLSEKQLREMKQEPWWADIQRQIMVEQNEGLLSKINNTIEQALVMLEDRILNGDVVKLYENVAEDGTVEIKQVRQPVKGRDLAQIFNSLTHQRNLMRGEPTQITQGKTTDERLNNLMKHFKAFTQATEIEGEVIEQIEEKG